MIHRYTQSKMEIEFIIDYNVAEEIITDDEINEEFMQKLKLFLHKQNKCYKVWINKNKKWYGSENCKIIISAEFNCNIYNNKKHYYQECGKCHIKRDCNVSNDFDILINSYGYSCEFIDNCCAGLFKI